MRTKDNGVWAGIRSSEWLLLIYFSYTALLAVVFDSARSRLEVAVSLPLVLGLLVFAGSRSNWRAVSIFRDWLALALVLVAYQEMDWFRLPHRRYVLEHRWVVWDKLLLNWGVREAIEYFGALLPSVLELSYLLTYAIPPLSIAVLYIYHRRERVDQFLFTFLLGTLLTYALLPYFPSDPPRLVFPGQDLPHVSTLLGRLNIWIFDHCDIRSSVFPSGHVTAAFSAAFAMLLTLPEKKWLGWMLFLLAVSIGITTVYARYHYAVDGLAGLVVSLIALGVSAALPGDRKF